MAEETNEKVHLALIKRPPKRGEHLDFQAGDHMHLGILHTSTVLKIPGNNGEKLFRWPNTLTLLFAFHTI